MPVITGEVFGLQPNGDVTSTLDIKLNGGRIFSMDVADGCELSVGDKVHKQTIFVNSKVCMECPLQKVNNRFSNDARKAAYELMVSSEKDKMYRALMISEKWGLLNECLTHDLEIDISIE